MVAGRGFLAAIGPDHRLRWLAESPAADAGALRRQLANMHEEHHGEDRVGPHVGALASHGGRTIVASTAGLSLRVFDTTTGTWRNTSATSDFGGGHPHATAVHPEGTPVAMLSRTATLFDIDTGRHLLSFQMATGPKLTAAFTPDGRFLALQHGPTLMALRLSTMQLRHLLTIEDLEQAEGAAPAPSTTPAFSGDGRFLFVSRKNMHAFEWSALEHLFARGVDFDSGAAATSP